MGFVEGGGRWEVACFVGTWYCGTDGVAPTVSYCCAVGARETDVICTKERDMHRGAHAPKRDEGF